MKQIHEDTPMGELMQEMPGARRALFAKYHLGGCQSCAFDTQETLAQLSVRSELVPAEVLAHLLTSHEHDEKMLLSAAAVKAKIDAGEEVRVIDIRTREEHEAVKIAGAEFFTQDFQTKLFSEKPSGVIVLHDHQGKSVLDQVAWFRGHQLKNTFGMKGGIDAWSQEVDKSVMRYRLEV